MCADSVLDKQDIAWQITVNGQPLKNMPKDFYIPPDAMAVVLEVFEGPLDLLLYLIRQQNIDILDIAIAEIAHQYSQYISVMQIMQLELASEYMLMAAMLAEIKSRMLLRRPSASEQDEQDDPRAQLIESLQQYERFKKAAESIDALERVDRDVFLTTADSSQLEQPRRLPEVVLDDLVQALQQVMHRYALNRQHVVERDSVSVEQTMQAILGVLKLRARVSFHELYDPAVGRAGIALTLLALLELARKRAITLVQASPYSVIDISSA